MGVFYSAGNCGNDYSSGFAQVVANMVHLLQGEPTYGACCIDEEPWCLDDVLESECPGIFLGHDTVCDPEDCQPNGVPDNCDIAYCDGSYWCSDCNENDIPDECDIADGTSQDDNGNSIPDECEPSLDVKPGSCPNPFNRSSHGVLPTAFLGTAYFDATTIDVTSIRLARADGIGGDVAPHEGPPGPHSVFEDVGTPFDGEPCDCHDLEGDGIIDLMMHFKTEDVVADLLLDDLDAGALVELVVTGELLDGTGFAASDCVRLVPPGTAPGLLTVQSTVPGAWIDVNPLDETFDGGGFADFERTFPLTTVVTLTAEERADGRPLRGWLIGALLRHLGEPTVQFTLDQDMTVRAVYGPTLPEESTPAAIPRRPAEVGPIHPR
jgi:hypothetical protein